MSSSTPRGPQHVQPAGLPTETDVLIVGAGPTGLSLAIALRRLGVEPTLLDLAGTVNDTTRAAGVQPRTLEDLARLGAADALIARGIRGTGFTARTPTGTLLDLDFGALPTPFPFVLLVPQNVTEGVLRDTLAGVGGHPLPRHRLLDFDEEFDAVACLVADPDGGVHSIRARYLVGCDGLHSGVRTRAGIGFPGVEHDQTFALADVRLREEPAPTVEFTFSPDGVLLRSALPDSMQRVVASVPPGTPPADLDAVRRLIDVRAADEAGSSIEAVVQSSTYHVSARLADSFGSGRVHLAGDAAHVHSPAGGQGMNTGIQDAVNLAWKLADVLAGGRPQLLDTYDAERRPNAAGVLGITKQITALAELTDPVLSSIRDTLLSAAGGLDDARDLLATKLSQLGVAYRAPDDARPDVVGRRLPLTDPPAAGLAWSTATLPDGRTARVRPDGYVDSVTS